MSVFDQLPTKHTYDFICIVRVCVCVCVYCQFCKSTARVPTHSFPCSLWTHDTHKQQNSFNPRSSNLDNLIIWHWSREVPRPEVSLFTIKKCYQQKSQSTSRVAVISRHHVSYPINFSYEAHQQAHNNGCGPLSKNAGHPWSTEILCKM